MQGPAPATLCWVGLVLCVAGSARTSIVSPCTKLTTVSGNPRGSREPALFVCRQLPVFTEGAHVSIIDGSWVSNHSLQLPSMIHGGSDSLSVDIVLALDGHPCSTCILVPRCLNVMDVTEFALLLLDLGAIRVVYSRLVLDGSPPPVLCGAWGDWRDSIDGMIASHGTKTTLRSWLVARESPAEHCADCAELRCGQDSVALPSEALDKQRSDKGAFGHHYTRLYDAILPPRSCNVRSLLEVGIGSVDPGAPANMLLSSIAAEASTATYTPGASLRAWLSVFPLADVIGLDVDKAAMVSGPRLRTFLVNSVNATQVREVLSGFEFDLIIDDGLHTPLGQLATLRAMWPYLRIGGLYIIEDVDANFGLTKKIAAEMGAVMVNTGSTHWVSVVLKQHHSMPIREVRYPRLDATFRSCWRSMTFAFRAHCCGQEGVFPLETACGFPDQFTRSECCFVHFIVEGAVA